jgi:uncharacterized protein (TIGR02145 family)
MKYNATTANTKPGSTEGFSDQIPTATTAGTYYVWYYVEGDANHSSSAIANTAVSVSIAQKAVTITAKAQTVNYGTAITTGTGQITASGLASGHSVSAVTLTPSTSNVPGGTITPSAATIQDGSSNNVTTNYNITYNTGTLTINKVASSMSNGSGAVSFTSSQKTNSTISRTITCTNCSVSGASVASGSGFSVSRSGNTITITRTSESAFSGTVTVTGTASNGNYNNPSSITISVSAAAVDVVDLGLSVKWARWNVGATSETGYGGYYCWGGTTDVTSTSINIDWNSNCPYWSSGEDFSAKFTKYVPTKKTSNWAGSGSPDNKLTLDLSDDAARQVMGGSWRMPTNDEWQELIDNCTWTRQDNYNSSGVAGYLVTSNKSGYTDKSIFLPAAGMRNSTALNGRGSDGYYWSSSLDSDGPINACILYLDSRDVFVFSLYRDTGFSVRAVQSK